MANNLDFKHAALFTIVCTFIVLATMDFKVDVLDSPKPIKSVFETKNKTVRTSKILDPDCHCRYISSFKGKYK